VEGDHEDIMEISCIKPTSYIEIQRDISWDKMGDMTIFWEIMDDKIHMATWMFKK
jgi:hypothetical protein